MRTIEHLHFVPRFPPVPGRCRACLASGWETLTFHMAPKVRANAPDEYRCQKHGGEPLGEEIGWDRNRR